MYMCMVTLKKREKSMSSSLCFVLFVFCVIFYCLLDSGGAYGAEYATRNYSGQNYTVINTITVSNPTNRSIANVRLTVPLMSKTDLGSWQSFVGDELNPAPETISVNADGGRDATYNIGRISANSSVTITQKFKVTNHAISSSFNFQNYNYSQADVNRVDAKYLQAEKGIESDNINIVSYAQSKTAGQSNPYLMAKTLFSDINLYLTYDDNITEHSALKALQTGRGNCVDYSYLYIACLRSLGIPARIYTGYLYSPDVHSASEYINYDGTVKLDKLKHNWVEFYVSGMGWVVADPTFTYYTLDAKNNKVKSVDWSRFSEITKENRLLTLYRGQDSGSVQYTGSTAPTVTYNSKLSVTDNISGFTDLVGHWAEEDVLALCNWSVPVVQGKTLDYFGVNDDITRAELVAIINRVLDYRSSLDSSQIKALAFSDVDSRHWAYSEIQKAVSRGYVSGFDDGTFQPNKAVTRAEMMAVLSSVANLPTKTGSPFADLEMSGYKWAKPAIENCYNAGLAKGITKNSFAPSQNLTRGEAAVFVNRWLSSGYYGE